MRGASGAQARRRWRVWSLLSVMVAVGMLVWATWSQFNLNAFGCDPFGYARQADLFRENGLINGFDTRIDTPETRAIVQVAKSVVGDPFFWSSGVAPYCHHYEELSGRIILQYPPGTGFLLSAFPEPVAMAYWVIIGCALVAALYVGLVVHLRPKRSSTLLAFLAIGVTFWLITRVGATGSPSIPFSIFLCPVVVLLSFIAFPTNGAAGHKGAALVFGLMCGFLLSIRLANIFLLIGLAAQVGVSTRIWRFDRIGLNVKSIIWAVAPFILTGPAMILYANHVNTGNAFITTYGHADTSPPALSIDLVFDNLRFYFGTWFGTPPLVIAIALVVLRFLSKPKEWWACIQRPAVAGALACMVVSVFYFLTHDISIEYYLVPPSIFVISMLCIESQFVNSRRENDGKSHVAWKIVALVFVAFVVARGAIVEPFRPPVTLPKEVFQDKTILWAEHSSGTSLYYLGKVASALALIAPELREDVVLSLARQGWTQYFVLDSKEMYRTRNLLTSSMRLSDVGSATNFGTFPVWRLEPDGITEKRERMKISSVAMRKYTPEELGRVKLNFEEIDRRLDSVVVDFEIVNPNDVAISAISNSPIRISWRFLDAQGTPKTGWDTRKNLPFDIPAHSSLKMNLLIDPAMEVEGGALQISFVQEGDFWAHDVGFVPLTVPWKATNRPLASDTPTR